MNGTKQNILAKGARWFDDWYAIEDIAPSVFAIGEPLYHQTNWNYLIIGSDNALLFDTGPGVRNIEPVVKTLTQKPLTVLPSHMHYDHTGNLHRFNHIAIADLPVLRACDVDGVLHATDDLHLGHYESMVWKPVRVREWLPIGHRIDLGGVRLEIIHTPGHSPDSISLWNARENALLAADFIYPGPLYAQVPGSNLQDYLTAAQQLSTMLNDQTRIFCAHGKPDGDGRHRAPQLQRSDIVDLITTLEKLKASGEMPGETMINAKMTLLASEAAFKAWQVS
jgi:hydroxyacylglutathione hydrolase